MVVPSSPARQVAFVLPAPFRMIRDFMTALKVFQPGRRRRADSVPNEEEEKSNGEKI
jgi:hypothetical protein